jgi:hypothetical protein
VFGFMGERLVIHMRVIVARTPTTFYRIEEFGITELASHHIDGLPLRSSKGYVEWLRGERINRTCRQRIFELWLRLA